MEGEHGVEYTGVLLLERLPVIQIPHLWVGWKCLPKISGDVLT
ncbi:MAG: hypothetical protein ACJATP_002708 [Candidatus Azotimanducaceae bacterium]